MKRKSGERGIEWARRVYRALYAEMHCVKAVLVKGKKRGAKG